MKNYVFRLAMTCLAAILVVSTSFAVVGTPTNGTCGDADAPEALKWEFDINTGTLTITGTGAMRDYDQAGEQPWYVWGDDITTVVIGEGVTRIGNYAFQDFPLTSIQTKKAEAVQTRADGGSEPIASALPEGLISIGKYALSNTQLTNLTLPSSLQRIDKFALFSNDELTTLTFLATMSTPELENDVFASCDNLTAIYVPETCVDDYKNSESWATYANLVKAIPEGGVEPGGEELSSSGTVIIGEKSDSKGSGYLPSYPNNTYSMSQQIYTKDEIGKKGKITSIAFYNYDTGSERNCDFYLTHTSKTSFNSNTDWVTVAESDKVFSGTVKFDQSKWTAVELDEPFEYDGKQNLLLTVDDNTGKDTGSNYNILSFNASGNHCLYYYKYSTPVNLDPTQPIEESGAYYSTKNKIKLCFEINPKPYNVKVLEVGDVSAQIQCSLREGTEKWNLRYRQAVAEGEQENEWTIVNNLTERSKTIEGLTAATKYEAQLQAVYAEGVLSDWTDPVIFVTYCCPVEQQAEIIYALNSFGRNWFGYGAQIVDVTKEDNPVEVAFLRAPSYQAYSGTVTLCCGHKYKVNWIYDEENPEMNQYYYMSLYFEPGDKFFSMAQGDAPNTNAELTEFVMDCGDYCSQSPQALSVDNTTYNSATITFRSDTKAGEVVYSTEAGFDPGAATPTSVNYEALAAKESPWGGVPNNASLTLNGLDPLTKYYVRVRNVCTGGVGYSRWSDPVEVVTGSRYDGPKIVSTEPVNSRSEKITFKNGGESTKVNLYYRAKVQGTPVSADAIQTIGSGKGKGFEKDTWGEGLWASGSEKPYSNILFVGGIGSNTAYSFNAGQGKTGADPEKFLYGIVEQTEETPLNQMKRLDYECMNDADKQARIKNLEKDIYDRKQTLETLYNLITNPNLSDEEKAQIEEKIAEEQKEIDELEAEKKFLEASLLSSAERQEKIKDLEKDIYDRKQTLETLYNLITNPNLSDEEKAQIEAKIAEEQKEIDELTGEKDALESATLNDDDKLQKMKDLESSLEQSEKKINELMESLQKGEITEAQFDEQIKDLNEDYFGTSDELNNLRAMMSAAQDLNKDGFTVLSGSDTDANAPKARTRAGEDKKYVFFIRHSNGDGWLLVNNLTFTPNDKLNAWTVVPNVTGSEYTITGLEPETTYEVMVEPIFDSGLTGTQSPIASFTTIGEETDPMEGEFSVSATKKVQFAKGNLRYEGDRYGMEAKWSMAPQQYEIFGEGNVDGSTPASPRDLFCWSNTDTRYGIYNYYYDSEENTQQYFQGDFTDWGTNSKLLAVLGAGWSTLNKDEWTYLLTERENAATLKAFATVNNVKGLILLPDDWTGGAPAATYTAEAWATMETAGAVFLPTAGQMTAVYNPDTYGATTTYTPSAIYWTSSPVDAATENALDFGSGLTFNETEATIANVSRRTYFAVRLVKALPEPVKGDANGDGIVNAVDIVEMVNAKNGNASVNFKLKNVDFDGNGEITDAEINAVADIILGQAK